MPINPPPPTWLDGSQLTQTMYDVQGEGAKKEQLMFAAVYRFIFLRHLSFFKTPNLKPIEYLLLLA